MKPQFKPVCTSYHQKHSCNEHLSVEQSHAQSHATNIWHNDELPHQRLMTGGWWWLNRASGAEDQFFSHVIEDIWGIGSDHSTNMFTWHLTNNNLAAEGTANIPSFCSVSNVDILGKMVFPARRQTTWLQNILVGIIKVMDCWVSLFLKSISSGLEIYFWIFFEV